MKTKTYGVTGLMEWQPIIHTGKATFKPQFTGGAMSSYGVTPAKYTTSNPIFQHIIENSAYFKSGRIELLFETDDGQKDNSRHKSHSKGSEETLPQKNTETYDETEGNKPDDDQKDTNKVNETLEVVEVSDMETAKDYLMDNYGIDRSTLRTLKATTAAATKHGIRFVVKD